MGGSLVVQFGRGLNGRRPERFDVKVAEVDDPFLRPQPEKKLRGGVVGGGFEDAGELPPLGGQRNSLE